MNPAAPTRVFDYYAMLKVEPNASHKEVLARFNTALIYQTPRMQVVFHRARAVLTNPDARQVLDDFLASDNVSIIRDRGVAFMPGGLAGAVWATSIDAIGAGLRHRELTNLQLDNEGPRRAFAKCVDAYTADRSDRNRRALESGLETQAAYHQRLSELYLRALGLEAAPNLNETYEEAVERALEGHSEKVIASLYSEIRRLIPVSHQDAVAQSGIVEAFQLSMKMAANHAQTEAHRQTLFARELSRVAKGVYIGRAHEQNMSDKLAVCLRVGSVKGWVYLSVVTEGNKTADRPYEYIPDRSVSELVADGFDVVAVEVKPGAIGYEVLQAVVTDHAVLYQQAIESATKEVSDPDLGLGLVG